MTLELRPEMTASPEDLFRGDSASLMRIAGINKLVRVADHIDEVRQPVDLAGLKMEPLGSSAWAIYKKDDNVSQSKFAFFTDSIDNLVWIAEGDVDYFRDLFGEKNS